MFKRLPGAVELWRNNRLYAVYDSSSTITGVNLVFANYPDGAYKVIGQCEGFVELMSPSDKDVFNKSLHFPAFVF